MMELDAYLKQVRKGMRGVAGRHKKAFCDELAAGAEYRGSLPGEDPRALGRAMRQVHGISMWLRMFFWVTAFPLGLLSMPFIEAWYPAFPATLFLMLATVWVLLAAYYGGRFSGLITGISAAIPRLLGLLGFSLGLDLVNSIFSGYEVTGGLLFAVFLTSIMLPLLGFFAGGRIRRPE